jgi:hypothetical protein
MQHDRSPGIIGVIGDDVNARVQPVVRRERQLQSNQPHACNLEARDRVQHDDQFDASDVRQRT